MFSSRASPEGERLASNIMIIDSSAAYRYIETYKELLLFINAKTMLNGTAFALNMLAEGRRTLINDPSLLQGYLASKTDSFNADKQDVIHAIRSLEVRQWVYFRDTRYYSILLNLEMDAAYAVYGLTQRIRDIVGASGAMVETGIVRYQGKFVCDGLISSVVWLGSNYYKTCAEEYRELKKSGLFHYRPEV